MLVTEQQLKIIIQEEFQNVLIEARGPFLKSSVLKVVLKQIRRKLKIPFFTSDMLDSVRTILKKAITSRDMPPLRITEVSEYPYAVSLLDLHKAIMKTRLVRGGRPVPEKISPQDAWVIANELSNWLEKQKGANITIERSRSLLASDEKAPPDEAPLFDSSLDWNDPPDEEDETIEPLTLGVMQLFFKGLLKAEQSGPKGQLDPEKALTYIEEEGALLIKGFSKVDYIEQKELLNEYDKLFQQLKNIHEAVSVGEVMSEAYGKIEEALEALYKKLQQANIETRDRLASTAAVKDISTKKWNPKKKKYVSAGGEKLKTAKKARAAWTSQ